MTPVAIDLVVDRLVLEVGALTDTQAAGLAVLVEEELRLALAGGRIQDDRSLTVGDVMPVGLSGPADPRLLARLLAQRIAAAADLPGWVHGRA